MMTQTRVGKFNSGSNNGNHGNNGNRGCIRSQKQGQTARQAMIISELNTIYRTNTNTHHIQNEKRTEPRIFLLDITLDDMNKRYPKIKQTVERGRLRPKGTETFFVSSKMEHIIYSDEGIYAVRNKNNNHSELYEYIPVDGPNTIIEIPKDDSVIPVLLDESYYEIYQPTTQTIISSHHNVIRSIRMVIKTHPKSMNSFVFILNEDESVVIDFYITTDNGVNEGCNIDRLTRTCKDDIISFVDLFKLCS
jgi:hypothetical protein